VSLAKLPELETGEAEHGRFGAGEERADHYEETGGKKRKTVGEHDL
jgi:hypothetical protein